jgi:hypothetical protein
MTRAIIAITPKQFRIDQGLHSSCQLIEYRAKRVSEIDRNLNCYQNFISSTANWSAGFIGNRIEITPKTSKMLHKKSSNGQSGHNRYQSETFTEKFA